MNPAIYNALYEQPWNIQGGYWRSMHAAFSGPSNLQLSDFFLSRQAAEIDSNGIAHISVAGVLGDQAPIAGILGDTDYGLLAEELTMAAQDSAGVLLHVNSPGGQASGMLEIGQLLGSIKVPTVAYASGLCCSAGYGIAVGADYIVAAPSAIVGSIGTIIPFVDQSALWEKIGLKADYITSGDLKAAGYPPSMTDEERESLQEIVMDLFAQFSGHVTRYRRVDQDSMRGQAFVAPRAKERNLIDAVGSEDDAYSALINLIR